MRVDTNDDTASRPASHPASRPDWVVDAVIVQIFPDRFRRSGKVAAQQGLALQPWGEDPAAQGFQGGDLYGVIEALDDLQELGATCLYLNPVFASAANHRYHTFEYFQVDPLLGGNGALAALVAELHRRGMRLILDGVFNHCGRGFWAFHHLLENGPLSPYVDWFHVEHWPLNPYGGGGGGGGGAAAKDGSCGYHCWWNDPALPSFNHANPAVRAYLLAVARHWIAAGVDGWRLDVPDEVPDDFWREFRAVVRAERPDAWIVGELWRDARPWLQSGLFDGTMNYPLAWAILGWVGARQVPAQLRLPALPEPPYQPLDQAGFRARVEEVLGWYGPAINRCQLNLLDSHDTPRALHVLGGDREALALALLLLFLLPGAPCLYYGTEMGLAGGTEPGCREAMPWDAFPLGAAPPLRPLLAGLSALRRSQPALRSSELAFTGSGHDDLLQLSRGEGPERVWVVINRGLLALPLALPAGATTVLWPPQSVGGPPPRELPPQHGLVLAFPAS
ncbi:glycoside hydrolase family 13 protein [Synechococcus sp. CS-602]|uniref:glycoside hydrolase family 13 protein n=1 Tax=Synechococcaceae TaxID=1890426 RepID=UPI0009F907FC|nr:MULTISPECIES: glycoside hydrolase family 13 protein [Synechococcaceae]MCT0204229.1 glycoside hydrolase family 13 protein [Synechococcus sp. CS-602]MCT0247070.1 glycoside hydrolase family 13 protein [Synechococcus sp. CS-601]MCT4367444.1 glycoside hydrolase family 13 protein [Candidatus Regnicoccus frigidus MAG-AL2]TWB96359.1 neopullulanase [Synechococcus sp. Ace-Pa]